MSTSLPLPLEPETFIGGQYSIETLMNSGGFGAVYRAIDINDGNRPCAIKETYDVTPAARRQALMEASILLSVRSRHLPRVYDAFEANGRFYLVMQLIEGQNFLQIMRKRGRPYSEQSVVEWFLPVMTILQELHSRTSPVIHRDIKPSNIIMTSGGVQDGKYYAVLVDFGITRLYDSSGNTQTTMRAVSEGFSPIEQYLGKTTPQSDIYALAATMYFLLTNTIPPPAVSRSVRDELIAPRVLNPALSSNIERVLLKALAVNADERYQSMGAFTLALKAPTFTAHADKTIAVSNSNPSNPAVLSNPNLNQNNARNTQAVQPGNRSSNPNLYPYYQYPSHYPQQVVQPSYPVVPAGYVMVPQSALMPVKSLPAPLGQGCLWGIIQGILAALLVLTLKNDASLYLAIGMGFLFYMLAGFMTARKGGKSSRGGWSGFWAGIASTGFFWFTLLLGLLILVSQKVQADTALAQQNGYTLQQSQELNQAWQAVLPSFLNQPASQSPSQSQSGWIALAVFLIGGALLAVGFGWLGGFLGTLRYKANMQNLQSKKGK